MPRRVVITRSVAPETVEIMERIEKILGLNQKQGRILDIAVKKLSLEDITNVLQKEES